MSGGFFRLKNVTVYQIITTLLDNVNGNLVGTLFEMFLFSNKTCTYFYNIIVEQKYT